MRLCGAVGLGKLVAERQDELLDELRELASDPSWRVREGLAMGLQRVGARSMSRLLDLLQPWAGGTWLEKRAVVGALCEPALVREEASAQAVLAVLDGVTDSMRAALEEERKAEDFRVLRQALGCGWSVAIVGCPSVGRPLLEKWLQSNDTDVVLLARENLKKDRLKRMDPAWVERWTSR